MAQDVADDQLAAIRLGRGDDALGIGDGGRQRLFDEDMRARLQRHDRVVGVAVGIGVDRDDVRLLVAQRVLEGAADARSPTCRRAASTSERLTSADDLEARIVVIGERVAAAHVAEAGDDDAQGFFDVHFTAPDVMPRISCREKMR